MATLLKLIATLTQRPAPSTQVPAHRLHLAVAGDRANRAVVREWVGR